MRRIVIVAVLCFLLAGSIFADNSGTLPKSFAGWTESGPAQNHV